MNFSLKAQILGNLCLLEGKDQAMDLLPYMGEAKQKEMKVFLEHVGSKEENLQEEFLKQRLKALRASETFMGLSEIHPAWLIDLLKKESPRVVGVILRHLPSRQSRYLLEHLPKRLVMELPKLIESFYVANEILDVVRMKIESHFIPMPLSHQIETFSFEHLYYLKIEELELLFEELGLSELSLALVGASKKILKIILNRFDFQSAKEISSRVKSYQTEDKESIRDARYSVFSLGGFDLGPKRFIKEMGILALAKAFSVEEQNISHRLKQKLSPENAYLLKRYLEEGCGGVTSDRTMKRKLWVVDHVRKLYETGKVTSLFADWLKEQAA